MEDGHIICPDIFEFKKNYLRILDSKTISKLKSKIYDFESKSNINRNDFKLNSIFGIFDGHGSDIISRFLEKN